MQNNTKKNIKERKRNVRERKGRRQNLRLIKEKYFSKKEENEAALAIEQFNERRSKRDC